MFAVINKNKQTPKGIAASRSVWSRKMTDEEVLVSRLLVALEALVVNPDDATLPDLLSLALKDIARRLQTSKEFREYLGECDAFWANMDDAWPSIANAIRVKRGDAVILSLASLMLRVARNVMAAVPENQDKAV
jgi:hypothetical protein